jgi:hypothetical protein
MTEAVKIVFDGLGPTVTDVANITASQSSSGFNSTLSFTTGNFDFGGK